MSRVNKILSVVLLTFFLGTMFFSLFHMSMGMDMSGGMTDCPFMSHGEVVCPMNFADHVGAWKSAFSSIVPILTIVFTLVGTLTLATAIAPNLMLRVKFFVRILYKQILERTYTFSHRPLQELFSSGILNPKLF